MAFAAAGIVTVATWLDIAGSARGAAWLTAPVRGAEMARVTVAVLFANERTGARAAVAEKAPARGVLADGSGSSRRARAGDDIADIASAGAGALAAMTIGAMAARAGAAVRAEAGVLEEAAPLGIAGLRAGAAIDIIRAADAFT